MLFRSKDVPIKDMTVMGKNRNVLKLMLEASDRNGNPRIMEAVYFGDAAEAYNRLSGQKTVSVLYQPEFNDFNGRRSIRLVVKDYM